MKEECKKSLDEVNGYLTKQCKNKVNRLNPCNKIEADCPCVTTMQSQGKVDLVLLIDSSGSMGTVASRVNGAAENALKKAIKECGADVRDTWLWVDAVKPGSSHTHDLGSNAGNFTESHQKYLEDIGAAGPFFHDIANAGEPKEQGADAIADISKYFDWRDDACRSIFYISDTQLEGSGSDAAGCDAAVNQAAAVANQNNVTVFAHRCDEPEPPTNMSIAEVDEDYTNLCTATGGYAQTGELPSVDLYERLIADAVCKCGGCKEVKLPEIKPCISISWGDSDCDCIETDDFEILCITACNCYSNVTFSNFYIGKIEITDSSGNPVLNLPDGTPSVQAIPIGPICFGNIAPCHNGEASCVSREFVINLRGAKEGEYHVNLYGICYDVEFNYHKDLCFTFKACKS